MSFSNNRKLRKTLSVILAVCMVAAMFSGCRKKTPADTEPTEPLNLNLNLNLTEPPVVTTVPTVPTEPQPVINENTGVALSGINVRSNPYSEAMIVATLAAGDRIEVSRREVMSGIEWAYIISPTTGWIVMDYVKMDMEQEDPGNNTSTPAGNGEVPTPTEGTSTTTGVQGTVTGNGLNVRSEPSTNGKIQGSYNKGDVITILEIQNGWGRTNKGWIKMDYVTVNGDTSSIGGTSSGTGSATGSGTGSAGGSNVTGNGSTTVQFRGIVTASELNVRAQASQNADKVGMLKYGARVEILEESGSWGRTKDGWISLNYVYRDGTTGTKTATGTVTADTLNIRSGPGTAYGTVGSLSSGETVRILEQFTYGDYVWGCISRGWIRLDFVSIEGSTGNVGSATNGSGTSNTDTDTDTDRAGTIIAANGLNVRAGAGTTYDVVAGLRYGDRVTVHRTRIVDGVTWGEIDAGWISMEYVQLD